MLDSQRQQRNNEIIEEGEEEGEEEEKEEEGNRGRVVLESVKDNQLEERSSGTVSMNGEDNIYVGVGKGDSSMEALRWTLDNLITSSSTLLFLIHVFPETRFIPYPLGRLPRDQASQEQVENYMSQEREKRRALLGKFLHVCSVSKVKTETILVESDSVAKAIQDLITILNIKKLVLGIHKSNARKFKSVQGNSVPEQIIRSPAVDMCEVKVICEGKELMLEEAMLKLPTKSSPYKSPRDQRQASVSDSSRKKDQAIDPFACICFIKKPKTNS